MNAFESANYPTIEPLVLAVGDRWAWKRELSDYPVASYTLSYTASMHGSTPGQIEITAAGSGIEHLIEVASTVTDDYAAGVYAWVAYITRDSDSERIQIGSGTWTLQRDRSSDGSDPRTYAQQRVGQLQDELDKAIARPDAYSIGGRSMTGRGIDTIRRELNHWLHRRAAEINMERIRSGRSSLTNLRVRF